MSQDRPGCFLSADDPGAVQYVDLFSSELLRLGKKIDCIVEGVKKFPDVVILQVYASIFYLYGQTAEMQHKASRHLDFASHLLERANERERSLYSVAWLWLNQLLAEALKNIERHCFKWPEDLTAIKIAEFLFYCKGQKYESQRFLRLTSHCYHNHKEDPFFLAIHSFALELCGKYDESWRVVDQALRIDKENPWAHHTLSHLYINKGLIDKGIEILERYSPLWSKFNHLIESHNFWHLALLYLENLDFEKTQSIYLRADWTNQSQLVGEEIDAASLLWRLDSEGINQSLNWKKLAESIGEHANFVEIPFLSVQLCYALKKGGREEALAEALTQINQFAYEQIKEERFVWREVGLPLLYGSLAYADRDYKQCLHYFDSIIEKMGCVGGSDVQIDLFYQTYLKSLMGTQRFREAEDFLHKMTQGRDLTKLERKWLAECQKSSSRKHLQTF